VDKMDKFEERLALMKNLKIKDLEELLAKESDRCQCPDCPTYAECAKTSGESLYCFSGKSKECDIVEVDCVCADCPVAKDLELKFAHFYCTIGAEKEQRKNE
jgi:hypothetical protein